MGCNAARHFTRARAQYRKRRAIMQQHELEQLMADSAKDAVGTSRDMFNIELDYSAESIELIDSLLLAFIDRFKDQALEDNAVFTLCNIYGAYIGEVMRS